MTVEIGPGHTTQREVEPEAYQGVAVGAVAVERRLRCAELVSDGGERQILEADRQDGFGHGRLVEDRRSTDLAVAGWGHRDRL